MQFATLLDRLPFDLMSGADNLISPTEVPTCPRQVVQNFVMAVVIVVRDKACDCTLKIARKVIVLDQDAALER